MISWKIYKTLTNKQKEEFNFRFKELIQPPVQFPYLVITSFVSLALINLFINYIIITNESMSQYKSSVYNIFMTSHYLLYIAGILVLGALIEYVIKVIIQVYQFNEWKKENNLKGKISWWLE